jgi:hypothetical protein
VKNNLCSHCFNIETTNWQSSKYVCPPARLQVLIVLPVCTNSTIHHDTKCNTLDVDVIEISSMNIITSTFTLMLQSL